MIGAERKERYRGFVLAQVDWYVTASRDGRVIFTATTVDALRRMIDARLRGSHAS